MSDVFEELTTRLRVEFSPSWVEVIEKDTIILDGSFTLEDLEKIVETVSACACAAGRQTGKRR